MNDRKARGRAQMIKVDCPSRLRAKESSGWGGGSVQWRRAEEVGTIDELCQSRAGGAGTWGNDDLDYPALATKFSQ
jgi:hypothetical protein